MRAAVVLVVAVLVMGTYASDDFQFTCNMLNSKKVDFDDSVDRSLGDMPEGVRKGKTCEQLESEGAVSPKERNYCSCATNPKCKINTIKSGMIDIHVCVDKEAGGEAAVAEAAGNNDFGPDPTDPVVDPTAGGDHWAALTAFVDHVKAEKKNGFCEHLATLDSEFIRKASDLKGEWVMAWRKAIDACNGVQDTDVASADGVRALVAGLKQQQKEGYCMEG